jgi:hypothetical protein
MGRSRKCGGTSICYMRAACAALPDAWKQRITAMHKVGFDYDPRQHRMLYRILLRGDRPY